MEEQIGSGVGVDKRVIITIWLPFMPGICNNISIINYNIKTWYLRFVQVVFHILTSKIRQFSRHSRNPLYRGVKYRQICQNKHNNG